jgi:Fe-S oxidoreductase/nitrate reductase gamma subunit
MFWNISATGQTLFLALGYGVSVLCVVLAGQRVRHVFRGRERLSFSALSARFKRLAVDGVAQAKLRKKPSAGRYHAPLALSVLLLFVGTSLVGIEYHFDLSFLRGSFYLVFEAVLDLMGVLLVVAVVLALVKPKIPGRPKTRDPLGDRGLLWLLLALAVTAFAVEGLRLAVLHPDHAPWSFVGFSIAAGVGRLDIGRDLLLDAHKYAWWAHSLLALGLVAIAPWSRLFHVVSAPLNIFFQPVRPRGALSTPFDIVNAPEREVAADLGTRIGPSVVEEFPQATLLAAEACTECGRCHEACPAWATGKPLSPMDVVLKLQSAMHHRTGTLPGLVVSGVYSPEELASCTTCGACVEDCPVDIDPVAMIVDLRRGQADRGKLDDGHETALARTMMHGNPWGMSPGERENWLTGQAIEIAQPGKTYDMLYWLGCAASFDDRARDIAKAMFEILRAAGLSFAVLGNRECCTGDFARRAGDEGLFQRHVAANLDALAEVAAPRILTHCPHCFNSFKNEYPEFGDMPPVIHHTQLIQELIGSGKLVTKPGRGQRVVFHDPCYLGRYNDIVDAPRNVLRSVVGVDLTEVARSRKQSFCCGAGGAHMWRTQEGGTDRIGATRLAQLAETGATRVATGCPFCMAMLEEAAQNTGGSMEIRDISEIVRESL